MPINTIRKNYALTAGGGTNNLPVTDSIEEYIVTGTATLLGSWVFQESGTPHEGLVYRFRYQAAITLSGNNVSFFGYSLTAAEALRNNIIEANYSGSSWTVRVIDDSEENGRIEAADLAADSVTTVKILDANVTTAKIANDAITTVKVLDANITSAKLASDAVTTAKILDANVTTAKIADANVTTAKILDANVTTAKIADGNVTTLKILDANVTTAKVADSAITTAKVNNLAITEAKIAPGAILATKMQTRSITALADANTTLTADQLVLSGLFTITPTALRTLTTDTAANILLSLPGYTVGNTFEFTVICLAAFEARVVAGAGVTLFGSGSVNNQSTRFICRIDSAVAITLLRAS